MHLPDIAVHLENLRTVLAPAIGPAKEIGMGALFGLVIVVVIAWGAQRKERRRGRGGDHHDSPFDGWD